ncbi:hypothetical protein HYFRA_00000695 [Hymenoscyphus fraxineus]|uniref:Uncharacterized protein n=1 Tax=Hymenoscyphus fraxineus TaxID=746836 RepID=A0A9N9L561_9HELO|nr:hypothetical protein HYFRA_00000695 [Hymenoscyphus fraxineus]
MVEPITLSCISTGFAFINSAVKFSELALKLCAVGSENGVFVRLILRVRNDLEEVERLINTPSVKKKLISTPGKLPYIKGVIFSTKSALNEIGRWVERVRTDKEGHGSISFQSRLRWVFDEHDKLTTRSLELSTNHQSLSSVLAYLMPLENVDVPQSPRDASPPNYHDATCLDEILPMTSRQRRKIQYRGSQLDLTSTSCLSPETKLRQTKSTFSLAQTYQESTPFPNLNSQGSFHNSSHQYDPSGYDDESSTGTSVSLSSLSRRRLSTLSTVSSMSTLASTDTYTNTVSTINQESSLDIPWRDSNLSGTNCSKNSPRIQSLGSNHFQPQDSLSDKSPSELECKISPLSTLSSVDAELPSDPNDLSSFQQSERFPATAVNILPKSCQKQLTGTNTFGPVDAYEMFSELARNPNLPNPSATPELQTKFPPTIDITQSISGLSLQQQETFVELPVSKESSPLRSHIYHPRAEWCSSSFADLPIEKISTNLSSRTATRIPTLTYHSLQMEVVNNPPLLPLPLSLPAPRIHQLPNPSPAPSQSLNHHSTYQPTNFPNQAQNQSQPQLSYPTQPQPISQLPQESYYQIYRPSPQSQNQDPVPSIRLQNSHNLPPYPSSNAINISPYTPFPEPTDFQQNREAIQRNTHGMPVSPSTVPATPTLPDHGTDARTQLSRSATLAESRRRNRRALLELF